MKLLISLLSLLPSLAFALSLNTGEQLPKTQISKGGELQYQNEEYSYSPWSSEMLGGKIRLLQVIAGRTSARELNEGMINAIKTERFSPEIYQTVTIVNLDDAIFGTSGFVKNKLKKNKKEFPFASFVLDQDGSLFEQWELKRKSSAIILLDQQSKVLFAKDGQLSEQEIAEVIGLIKNAI